MTNLIQFSPSFAHASPELNARIETSYSEFSSGQCISQMRRKNLEVDIDELADDERMDNDELKAGRVVALEMGPLL